MVRITLRFTLVGLCRRKKTNYGGSMAFRQQSFCLQSFCLQSFCLQSFCLQSFVMVILSPVICLLSFCLESFLLQSLRLQSFHTHSFCLHSYFSLIVIYSTVTSSTTFSFVLNSCGHFWYKHFFYSIQSTDQTFCNKLTSQWVYHSAFI
jgi:hypothetical protein